jgi:hypothetical protein
MTPNSNEAPPVAVTIPVAAVTTASIGSGQRCRTTTGTQASSWMRCPRRRNPGPATDVSMAAPVAAAMTPARCRM